MAEKNDEKKPTGIPVKSLIFKQGLNHTIQGRAGDSSVHHREEGGIRYAITFLPAIRHHRVEVFRATGSKAENDEQITAIEEHMIHETHVADWLPLR